MIHDAEPRGTETMTVARDPRALVERRRDHARASCSARSGLDGLDLPLRLRRATPGIDFPGESPGFVLPLDHWSGSTIGNVPIGQGIAVTPMQMAAAYAAIANGGVWVQPHLVDHVRGRARADGRIGAGSSRAPSRASSSAMLENVVADGHGHEAAVPGYTVAGKTGTAAEAAARQRLLDGELRRVVRRLRARRRGRAW